MTTPKMFVLAENMTLPQGDRAHRGFGFAFGAKDLPVVLGDSRPGMQHMRETAYISSEGLQLSILYPLTHYEEAVLGLRKFRELFPERALEYVVDLGANAGAVGLLAAHWGALRCLLVEPTFLPRLYYNVCANRFEDRCVILPYAVWHTDGQTLNMSAACDPAIMVNVEKPPIALDVGTLGLSPVLTMSFNTIINMLPRVDFLKIDVDGGEYFFLTDAVRPVLKKVQFIDLELHIFSDGLYNSCFDVTGVTGEGDYSVELAARKIVKMLLDEGFLLWRRKVNTAFLFADEPDMRSHMLFYRPQAGE